MNRSTASLLELTQIAIYSVDRDADIQKRMAHYGFTPKRMQEGTVLRQEVITLLNVKENHYDESWVLSQQIEADLKKTNTLFKEHVRIARSAFRKDVPLMRALRIKRIATKRWEWPQQALNFYTKLEERNADMTAFDISQEDLQQIKASVETILEMRTERISRKGEAQNSTHHKDQVLALLRAWLTEFHAVARIAFKESPQRLEAFGIIVPSGKK